jgi:hypothetical protein
MIDDPLTPAAPDDLVQALAHALQFDGRRPFKVSGEMMARITAAHLVECLRKSGYIIMKRPAGRSAVRPLSGEPPS